MDYSTICAKHDKSIVRANAFGDQQYIYARYNNEAKIELEKKIARLYGGNATCLCLANGIACLNFALFYLKPKHILADVHINHEAYDLLRYYHDNVRFADFMDTEKLSSLADRNTLAVFDVVSNPLCREYDVGAICRELHKSKATVLADNTMLTSYYCNPLESGADIVVESLSKYACGHGDAMGGAILFKGDPPGEEAVGLSGYAITPDAAYMVSRGLVTMPLRLEHIRGTTEKVHDFLAAEGVRILGWDARCGMITFNIGEGVLPSRRFVKSLQLIKKLFNFGQECTTISECCIYPQDEYQGISRIRLCIGLESPDDIICDLDQALGNGY